MHARYEMSESVKCYTSNAIARNVATVRFVKRYLMQIEVYHEQIE